MPTFTFERTWIEQQQVEVHDTVEVEADTLEEGREIAAGGGGEVVDEFEGEGLAGIVEKKLKSIQEQH